MARKLVSNSLKPVKKPIFADLSIIIPLFMDRKPL